MKIKYSIELINEKFLECSIQGKILANQAIFIQCLIILGVGIF